MKSYKLITIIIVIFSFSFLLNANEKKSTNYLLKISLNNEITDQFNFCFKSTKLLNNKTKLDNNLINTKEYLKKARGFLALGVTGIIFTSLSLPASVGGTILLWYFAPGIAYTLFFAAPILFFIPFLAIGLPPLIIGFYYHRKYKKISNSFTNKNNEIVILKFNFKRYN